MTKRWKKPPVKAEVRREWLRRYEEDGESPPQIAQADSFDVRTVRSQIERAKEEREVRVARASVLRSSVERHFADLCELSKKINGAVAREDTLLAQFKDDRMYQAMRQHLPRSPIWKYLDRWDNLLNDIDSQQIAIKNRLDSIIKANKKLNNLLSSGEAERVRDGLVVAFSYQTEQWARGLKGLDINENFIEEPAEEGCSNLSYGRARMDNVRNEHIAIIKEVIIAFESKIRRWQEYEDLRGLYTEFLRLKSKLQDELAVIIYRRTVPGRCKYCSI